MADSVTRQSGISCAPRNCCAARLRFRNRSAARSATWSRRRSRRESSPPPNRRRRRSAPSLPSSAAHWQVGRVHRHRSDGFAKAGGGARRRPMRIRKATTQRDFSSTDAGTGQHGPRQDPRRAFATRVRRKRSRSRDPTRGCRCCARRSTRPGCARFISATPTERRSRFVGRWRAHRWSRCRRQSASGRSSSGLQRRPATPRRRDAALQAFERDLPQMGVPQAAGALAEARGHAGIGRRTSRRRRFRCSARPIAHTRPATDAP